MTVLENEHDDWEPEDELAPTGRPAELVHLALTCNGGWGLGIRDAIGGRNAMRECGDEPPVVDSAWKHELEMVAKLHGYDAYEMARRIAWQAYSQGIVHGEVMLKHRLNALLNEGDKLIQDRLIK